MTSKPAQYVHCAKCGYRGVDQKHDCTKVRAAVAAVVEQAAERQRVVRVELPLRVANPCDVNGVPMANLESPLSMSTQLVQLSIEHRRQFGRGLEYALTTRDVGNTDVVVLSTQRCAACCEIVTKTVHVRTSEDFWQLKLGAESRKAYLLHRCPPVESALLGFSWDELEELHAGLERDMNQIAERLADIEKLRKAR